MDRDANDPVGRVLDDRYRVVEVLGAGGMGTVYLGEHVVIGRQVAIKILGAALAKSDDFAERFRREAIAAGRLDHPNCVPVTDSGQLEDGSAYMVMELVKGESLGKLLREEGGLDAVRALRILRHVLRGLSHAHNVEIVHRDIKPDNIMLIQRDGDRDFARILDFGIAKLRDEESKNGQSLTQVGMAVGTPSYLSPEQAFGDHIDHRSDLYSCAVLLFEMLSGRAPYVAESSIGVLTKHASAPIPHLWDIAGHLQDAPILDAITQRGLGKARDERFQSATEFISAIDHALQYLGCDLTPVPQDAARVVTPWPPPTAPWPPPTAPGLPRSGTSDDAPMPRDPTAAPASLPRQLTGTEATMMGPALGARRRQLAKILAGLVLLILIGVGLNAMVGGKKGSRGVLGVSTAQRDALLQRGIEQLEDGKTCKDRLQGVHVLNELGDPRAIPNLESARRRMHGGLLGIGRKNANRCLSSAAREAIEKLEKLEKR